MNPRPAAANAIGIMAFAVMALAPSQSRADSIIDLTAAGAPAATNQGAIFSQTSAQPTGTGVFQPFVRIQQKGTEAGYNTDARPVEFQTKDQNQWTHSLLLSGLDTVTVNGTKFYQFELDINEQGTTPGSLLSMDDFRIYLGDSGNLTGFHDGFGSDSVKIYDIDAGPNGNTTVNLNAALNPPGSGVADLNVFVPVALVAGLGTQYPFVYLYSSFGNPDPSGAGFEEWSSLNSKTPSSPPPTTGVPAPPGLLLGAMGVGGCLLSSMTRRKLLATSAS